MKFNHDSNTKYTILWVDDMRNPYEEMWSKYIENVLDDSGINLKNSTLVWIEDYDEFEHWMNVALEDMEALFPDVVFFDHDLGEGKSGMDCAKLLVNICMDNDIILPLYHSQSSNPVGKENISKYLYNYMVSEINVHNQHTNNTKQI